MEANSILTIKPKRFCKFHPKMPLISICRSPFCGYYRELCQKCILLEQDHKQKYHVTVDIALTHVQNRVRQIQKSMLILKKQKEQKLKINPITLPLEIKDKLSNIRQIINDKISLFQKSLQQLYEEQVNLKLQNLQDTIKKSLDFLKRQLSQLEGEKYLELELKKFFVNFQYWEHERKYYKSYMEEILQKQVRNFKEGFDDDNIMKLIVNFQINLRSIFSQNKQNLNKQIIQRPHLFFEERKELKKYQIVDRHNDLHFSLKAELLDRPYPKQNYKWDETPQSLYYPDYDCFYIFGQGNKTSNTIIKYEDGKQNGNKKLTLVAQMFTKRSNFSVCLINSEIFIIGGYNQKEGCMSKCQKMIVNQKIKIYLVSSLQQRSACHSTCNYKNKYILKFGGTSIKVDQSQKYKIQGQIKQLYPQIYEIGKQQWRVIKYNFHNFEERLQFGLWPLIVIPFQTDQSRIVVFGNKTLDKKYVSLDKKKIPNQKTKFQIKCIITRNEIQMKIVQSTYNLNKKYFMYPQTIHRIQEKNKTEVIGKDISKHQNSIHLIDLQSEEPKDKI